MPRVESARANVKLIAETPVGDASAIIDRPYRKKRDYCAL